MITFLLLAIITLLLACGLCRRTTEDPRRAIPGPSPLPVIGNLADLSRKDLHVHLGELAKAFGAIYRLRMWRQDVIVLSSVEMIKEALVKRPAEFAGRPQSFVGDFISLGGKDLSLGDYTHTWKIQKKTAHTAMQWIRTSVLEPVVTREAEKLCKVQQQIPFPLKLESHGSSQCVCVFQSMGGLPVDPSKDFSMSTCKIICSLIFSKEYERSDPELQEIHDCLLRLNALWGSPAINLLNMWPVLQYFPNPAFRELRKAILQRDSFIQKHVQNHKATFQKGVVRDITDMVMKSFWNQEDTSPETREFTEEHAHMVLVDLFIGGIETTSTTLSWAIAHLVQWPEIQDRVYWELCSIVGEDRYASYADHANLPFLAATIAEVLRLNPVVPLSLPHRTTCDTSVAGYTVRKGTTVITNLYAANREEMKWENPSQFKPERFLDMSDAGKTTQNIISFGTGARTCLGEAVARTELFIFLAYLLRDFKFLPWTSGPLPDLQGVPGFMMKVKPYQVIIAPRANCNHL
ncbi:steroid 21-hydroxylase [Narcine bancroftii]|uniref:steroid 21-hydroxylase n=1 Tax=Narcine bancroftii TaxID=1343680 RepID=UPI0038319D71